MAKEIVLTPRQQEMATGANGAIELMANVESAAEGITLAIRTIGQIEELFQQRGSAPSVEQARRFATDPQMQALVTLEQRLIGRVNDRAINAATLSDTITPLGLPMPSLSESTQGRNLVLAFGGESAVVPFGRFITRHAHAKNVSDALAHGTIPPQFLRKPGTPVRQ